MKKITFFIGSLAGGGAEGVCVNVSNGLIKLGWQVDIVVLNLDKSVLVHQLDSRINIYSLNVFNARYALIPIIKYIFTQKPVTIVAFTYELSVLLILIRRFFRLKFKVVARNINTLSKERMQNIGFWRHNIVNPLIDNFYLKSDHVINQCIDMESDLLTIYPSLKGRTSVIYNAVNSKIESYLERNDISHLCRDDYLLCIGRLEEQKAFHFAIEAFSYIHEDYPHLRLKLVGDGSLKSMLINRANEFGVIDKVDFEGFQAETIHYYMHAKATLLTSLYEGFPNVLIESISLGTPVVSFNCKSGPSEIVKSGVNGFIVEQYDVKGLASSIRTLLDNEVDRHEVLCSSLKYKNESIIFQWHELLCKYSTQYD